MLSTQTKSWVGTGALKYSSAMVDSKKASDNNTDHVTQKRTSRAQAPAVCEKTFSTYFVPQPVENTTSHTPLGAIVKLTAANYKA